MIKQMLIVAVFVLFGSFFISVACVGLLSEAYSLDISVLLGALWGGYVAHRAVRSGAFDGKN